MSLYEYRALVKSVYDGDTITVDVDLGFGVVLSDRKIRLAVIDAPELRGLDRPQGLASRNWLRSRILGEYVTLQTQKDATGKYGRYIGTIYLDGICINDEMIEQGMAEPYE